MSSTRKIEDNLSWSSLHFLYSLVGILLSYDSSKVLEFKSFQFYANFAFDPKIHAICKIFSSSLQNPSLEFINQFRNDGINDLQTAKSVPYSPTFLSKEKAISAIQVIVSMSYFRII